MRGGLQPGQIVNAANCWDGTVGLLDNAHSDCA
jgi:hypothetical protein